ncbi:MAG TPA: glycosyltransferase family 87 protein [Candidatus Udaeobacter sp.]|nr:glycosyltransferase family 87 protein [Candidatus Udaeobacter sp.]
MITQEAGPAWISSLSACITQRRIFAHAVILVLCLWGVCAADFATPGTFDRAGNIKFQDFLSFYISGKLIAQRRAADLYNEPLRHAEMLAIAGPIDVAHETVFPPTVHTPTNVRIPNLYGPQVALVFVPLARLPFLIAAQIWVALTLLIYFVCIYVIWRCCPNLLPHRKMTALAAIAFPPLFHVFVRGQISTLVLACLTAAVLALQADRLWLAGVALGFLFLKPQFLVAIPLVLLLAHAWKILIGMVLSVSAQLALARVYFGPTVVRAYFDMLRHSSRWIDTAEGSVAPIQMHSLRSFFSLLIPWPAIAFALYVLSSICVVWLASRVWKSQSSVALRFSALTLAAVLINPHLFVYDLLVMAPASLLLTDWSLQNSQHPAKPALDVLLYLAFLLPLFGPLAHWTHLQVSVVVFVAIMWILHRIATASHKLAFAETGVV